MRIQHNIMAINAYRNYTTNVSSMKKNLEKLSSGYKINRAGDDAAGLAISEKMRAQITGLKQAQSNAKSGINLVQTAEGALTEVHDMLNRMFKLAEQSANGTFDDTTDRDQLQKEVTQLTNEINRIADSANFNGIKLLDGSLAGGGSSSGAAGSAVDVAVAIEGATKTGKDALADDDGTEQVSSVTFTDVTPGTALAKGDKFSVTMEMSDGTKFDLEFEVGDINSGAAKVLYGGADTGKTVTVAKATGAEISAIVAAALTSDDKYADFVGKYTPAPNGTTAAQLDITSAEAAFGDPSIKVATVKIGDQTVNLAGSVTTEGKGKFQTFDTTKAKVYDAADDDMKAEDSIYTVNGQKFAFAKDADSAKAFGADVNVVIASATTPADTDAAAMVALMNQKLGTNFEVDATTDTTINMISKGGVDAGAGGSSGAGGGLVLQIGDTADSFNQLTVSVEDMHANAMGIGSIDISKQGTSQAAMDAIKNAINYVSNARGTLGATQNRLDHTINNLSVMEENIQDAESTIRDTDVADEMMAYTKNNILIQSAQAMLAQANQVPQGVLQLLQ